MSTFKPHLACDVDFTKLKFPCWGMPKVDGCRALNVNGKAVGRSLKAHANKHFTKTYSQEAFWGFDGEVTFGDIRGESLCRDTTSVLNRIEGEPDVAWNLFDYVHPTIAGKPYKDRYNLLVETVARYKQTLFPQVCNIYVIPYSVLSSIQEAEDFYQEQLELGYEGAIYRDPLAAHKSGRCTAKEAAYVRAKPQSDKEAKVIRLVEAEQNLNEAKVNELGRTERSSHKENKVGKGMVGVLVCVDVETGIEIDVGAGKLTHEERTYYWEHPEEMIGQFIKYRSMDKGVKDKPRFARYICKRAESDMS